MLPYPLKHENVLSSCFRVIVHSIVKVLLRLLGFDDRSRGSVAKGMSAFSSQGTKKGRPSGPKKPDGDYPLGDINLEDFSFIEEFSGC